MENQQPYSVDQYLREYAEKVRPNSVLHISVGDGSVGASLREVLGPDAAIQGIDDSLRNRTDRWNAYSNVIIGEFLFCHFSSYDLVLALGNVKDNEAFLRRIAAHNKVVLVEKDGAPYLYNGDKPCA